MGLVGKNDEIFESDVDTLVDLPLGDLLKKDFPDIKFAVENDMNLMALGFYQKQAYQEDKTVAVIDFPWEFCVGSGIIVDGHIMKGNTNFASEISYLPFLPQGGSRRLCDLPDDAIIGYAVQTLVSMVAIINPDTIVLIDKLIRPDMLEAIRQGCQHIIPRRHMPRILISGEHHNFGLAGLAHATMECLDYNLMLVEKRL